MTVTREYRKGTVIERTLGIDTDPKKGMEQSKKDERGGSAEHGQNGKSSHTSASV